MLIVVNKDNQHLYLKEMVSMHQLRKRVFYDLLGWDLKIIEGMEFDQFDTPDAYYILNVNEFSNVDGVARLIPTEKPYLLGDVFPYLIDSGEIPREESIWEATRFCADPKMAPADITALLLIGMQELATALDVTKYLSVIDVRLERKIKSCGWLPSRMGSVHTIPDGRIVSNCLDVSTESYKALTSKCQIQKDYYLQNLTEVLGHLSSLEAA